MAFENIRNLRERYNLRQEDLAEYLHVTQTTYSKYELGNIAIPVETLIKLANYYRVTLDYLVGRKHLQDKEVTKEVKDSRYL